MANNQEPDLRSLIHKRGAIKARITQLQGYVNSIQGDGDFQQLKLRREKIETTWQEFEDVQTRIEALDVENLATHTGDRESFENSFFAAVAAAERSMQRMTPPPAHSQTGSAGSDQQAAQVKLPTIDLPTFNGAYDQWLEFVDTFQSLIHDNASITPIQKFHYLRSALKGDAAQVIYSLEISSNNYEIAWELLKERFQNKRIIVQNHVKAIFDLQIIQIESHISLRQLFDTISRHLRALKSLDQPTESWDTLIIHIITSKFDQLTKREWESIVDAKELPTMVDMNKFLQHRCHLLQSLDEPTAANKGKQQPTTNVKNSRNNARAFLPKPCGQAQSYAIINKPTCPKCQQTHFLYQCKDFTRLPVSDRVKEVKKLQLCINCLRADHQVSECGSGNCRVCARKHNTLLHLSSSTEKAVTFQDQGSVSHHAVEPVGKKYVILSTAVLIIYDYRGKPHSCRALLDSGSQSSFISKELATKLNLSIRHTCLPVTGINKAVTDVNQIVHANIKSRFNNFSANLSFLVLPKITERLPAIALNRSEIRIPGNLKLADPMFDTPGSIDILLGAEIFWNLICVGQIKTNSNLPILQKTQLGWIVSGSQLLASRSSFQPPSCHLSVDSSLHEQVNKFWLIEEMPERKHLSPEETACEKHFVNTTTRCDDGRFVVELPLRTHGPSLGDSKTTALKRFRQLERKFSKDPMLKSNYCNDLNDYIQTGHMQLVPESEIQASNQTSFYLPHHAVLKEDSPTTKLRVVFDGSSRSSTGASLNNLLMVGPTIQDDLVDIMTRFRMHRHVITADIVKMYRQIWVHPSHTDLQRILWRDNPDRPIQTYRLQTVTFGTASAPYLATRCLNQLAADESLNYPTASRVIEKDFYVDDLITGAETRTEVTHLKTDLQKVLAKGGFVLHKWNATCPELRGEFSNNTNTPNFQLDKHNPIKTLGLFWDSDEDNLSYKVKASPRTERCTKRYILTITAGIFDPLGLLGPVIITAKMIMQQLWQLQSDWDETVPISLFTKWQQFEVDLQELNQLKIPRRVFSTRHQREVQVHGFCDASETAYGACIYFRTTDPEGNHSSNLLCAKSRVAPLKTISIPRLELCSALLLARLMHKTIKSLGRETFPLYYWTDSTVALAWISSSPHKWKTFVANRTCEIQDLSSNGIWRHVRSQENPADLLSRGVTAHKLCDFSLWWNGPTWLSQGEEQWPIQEQSSEAPQETLELRKVTTTFIAVCDFPDFFERFSSLSRLVNVTAYCIRFKSNCFSTQERQVGPLQVSERQQAMNRLIHMAQQQVFGREFQQLSKSNQVHTKSQLLSLNPFIDEHGLLRVGGRLQQSSISQDQKHPIILPSKHKLTYLIISGEHVKQLHAGAQSTLANVRLKFWPIAGYQTTKNIVRKCIRCFKNKPSSQTPRMGQLPGDRINPSRPFSICGVDFGGPFNLREGGRRSKKRVKAYMAIFVCFATRATHLELVSNLTTEAFLGTLKRFTGRRGKPAKIFSDNATNFVGADRELRLLRKQFSSEQHQAKTASSLAEEGIEWNFIPPASPHFGGIWEAAIKSAKRHLRRVVGDAALSFEELNTVLVQIESCLNSRPLTPISSDPKDLSVLTPGHFLIGDSLAAPAEPSLTELKINRLSRWQRTQQLTQHFWTRWSKEYLMQLQQRQKWNKTTNPLTVGSLVIIRDDHSPPLQWPLGRVTDLHPGPDGVVRVATVLTRAGTFKRPVTKLCVLPLEEQCKTKA